MGKVAHRGSEETMGNSGVEPSSGVRPAIARDAQVDIAVNQVGFLPGAHKRCVLPDARAEDFAVTRLETGEVAYHGHLQTWDGDFGRSGSGDFSTLRDPGAYYIRAGQSRSFPFRISHNIYDGALQAIVRYFSLQRCGPSATGYLAPCHLDDGVRLDDGKHQDVTGGWHDASDLRKWVGATIYGMIGLARLYEGLQPSWDHGQIMEESRWGNRYFLTMQEPAGYVLSHVGGDVLQHADSNRWTDNLISTPVP
jgi:hypothetical protein